jgi:hypothetical protein
MSTALANRSLQIATRIHFALLREIGVGIDIGRLLKQPLYARDVLLVCDACTGHDLPRLATALRGISADGVHAGASSGASSQFSTSLLGGSQFSPSQLDGSSFGASQPADGSPHSQPPESVPAA